jgi:RND family efflux transporter MFP subunit
MPKFRNVRVPALLSVMTVLLLSACGKPAPAPEPERAVRTQLIESGTAGMTREFAAEIRARTESRLSFRVGGKIQQRLVNLGDKVRAGQVLAQLDAQDLRLGSEAAQAQMIAARTNRDQAGADYRRFIELHQQGFISAAELERRDAYFKAAQAQLDQAKAQASVQGNQVAYAALVADAPGVVTGVDAEPGMVVGAGMPVLRVAHDGPRDVVFAVPEDQVSGLRAAAVQPGALRLRLWGEKESQPLVLREVSAAADPVTRTFQVKADVGKTEVKLGQTAAVLWEMPRLGNVVKLPLSAILERGGKSQVWILDPAAMTVRAQAVQIGGADGNSVVIAAGLQPGQEVVTAGVHVLTDGQKVRRYAGDAAPAAAPATAASR